MILLDIWLPGMDGIQVVKHVRQDKRISNLPIVALTANAMPGDRERYLAAGFTAYISKPIVHVDEFVKTLRQILNDSQLN